MTVVITIEVPDALRDAFLSEIRAAVDQHIAGQAGFISASFHKRIDAPGVLNYAQWASEEDYNNFLKNPAFQNAVAPVFARHAAMPSFARYEVVGTHVAS